RLIARPRRRVTVTRRAGWFAALDKVTPRPVGDFVTRRLGIDRIFLDEVDRSARAAYDERVRENH
ncbi:short-chain dehydrogenase, partial [Nocardia sp. NPDC005978]